MHSTDRTQLQCTYEHGLAEAFELILDERDNYSVQVQVPGADLYFEIMKMN